MNENANQDSLAAVQVIGRKRKSCEQLTISNSQPTVNTKNKKDWFQEYKKQKALVTKHTRVIERHVTTIERLNKKLCKVSKQSKVLQDIVNSTF